jgi:hypothetical protein
MGLEIDGIAAVDEDVPHLVKKSRTHILATYFAASWNHSADQTKLNDTGGNMTAHSSLRKVPTLSLAAYTTGSSRDRDEFVDNLFVGLKEYGFVILKDHNVKYSDLQRLREIGLAK